MSVYIKVFPLPNNCGACPLRLAWCRERIYMVTRPERCPLIPVPPHGRLIDADAILGKINAIISAHPDEADLYEQDAVIVRDWLRSEPTVIEREKT